MSETPTPPAIFIASPIHHNPEAQFMISMLHLIVELQKQGIGFSVHTPVGDSLITRARNNCVATFLKSKATHLLFLDSDLGFRPKDIVAMLKTGHGLIGGIYPKKRINWEAVRSAAEEGEKDLSAHAGDYVVNLSPGEYTCVGGCVPVDDLGTGFMLVSREVIEKFVKSYPELAYVSNSDGSVGEPVCAVFDCMIDPATKLYLSEDYAFCRRCQKIGIQPMAYLPAKLVHVGKHEFQGDLATMFQGLEALLSDEAA